MQTVHNPPGLLGLRTSKATTAENEKRPSATVSVTIASLDHPNPGGVTTAIDMTARQLIRAGHRVEVLGPDLDQLGFGIPADLVGTTLLERYWDLRSSALIHAFERSTSGGNLPDVILATDVVGAHRLMERTSIPVVAVIHGIATAEDVAKGALTENSEEYRYLFDLERAALQHAAAVITVSDSLRERLESVHPGIQASTIQNPIDTDHFRPGDRLQARKDLGWQSDAPIVFCPSRNNRFKGIEHLVSAAAEIDASIVLTEAPPGPLPENVTVVGVGPHDEMRKRYVASDLVVIPSVMVGMAGETSSLVAIEAASCGVPVIASGIGGLREVSESLGFETFASGDPRALAEAARRALDSTVDADDIRKAAIGLHGADRYVQQVEEVLAEVTPRTAPLQRRPFFHSSAAAILAAAQSVAASHSSSVRTLRDNPISNERVSEFMGGLPLSRDEAPRLFTLTAPPSSDDLVQKLRQKRYWRNPPVARPDRQSVDGLRQPASRELKVTYVANRLDPCGGARIVIEHANRLAAMGHEVTLLGHGPRPDWHPLTAGFRSVPLGADWHQFAIDADVIVATYWDQIADLSRAAGTLVYFEQGDFHLYEDVDDSTRRHVQENLDCADLTITLSEVASRALVGRYGIVSHTIANAIDSDVFCPGDGVKNGCRMIIVGNETAEFKGITELIDLWRQLSVDHPDLELDWVTAQQPEDPPTDEGIRIHVSPDQAELARLYREATVYVSASRYETFPLPPLEAMASATPVVSFSNGGILEYAEHDGNALLVSVGEMAELEDAVLRLLADETLRATLTTNGLRSARQYRWKDIMNHLESILTEAAAEEPVHSDVDNWTISLRDDDFMDAEDVERFNQLLTSTSACEIELPVVVEGPPNHMVAHWERVAWRSTGNDAERHLLPLRRPHSTPDRSHQLLMAGESAAAFESAKARFAAADSDGDRIGALRWMLFSLIELEQDAAAVSLAREAIATYPGLSDFAYLGGAIANLTGDNEGTAAFRDRVMLLGPAVEAPEFLWNVADLASSLPVEESLPEQNSMAAGSVIAPAPDITFRAPQAAFGTYVGRNRMLIAPRWGGKLIVPADDLSLTPTLVHEGMYDPGLTRFLIANLQRGDTFVDVGANLGVFSVLAALRTGPRGRVHAVEANPALVEVIADNVAINYLQDHIEVTGAAAVSKPGNVQLMVTGRFMGESSIAPAERDYRGEIAAVTVPGVRLDDLAIGNQVRIMKVDVEGAEVEALLGAGQLISRTEWLIVEWNRIVLGDQAEDFIALIRSYVDGGARLGVLADDGSVLETDTATVFGVPFRSGIALRF